MKQIVSYFLQGLLYITPIAATIYVLYYIFSASNSIVAGLGLPVGDVPGVGLLVLLVLITLSGYVGQKIIKTPFANMFESVMKKAPLVRIIYTSVKDLMSAFVGKERKFDSPVLVSLDPTHTVRRLGFITSKDLTEIGLQGLISVYLPCSYGLLGDLIIVRADQVEPVDANSTDVMKFIVSGGVTKMKQRPADGAETSEPKPDLNND